MNLESFYGLLAFAPPAQPGQTPTAPGWTGFMPIILMMVIFYFILIRPQQKKAKQHEAMLKTMKAGDKVITGSGVIGVIISVKDRSVTLRSADSKMEFLKSAVTEILERSGEEPPKAN